MGYLQVQEASTFVLGVPAATQTQFVIEGAFTKVLPSAEARFRRLLDLMDRVEDQIEDNTENVAVDRVDEIELRKDELTQLIKRYKYWQGSLSNLLGVPPNPFDARPMLGMGYNGGGGINISVTG
jgi:uncharacterized protein YdcH (DUF465 family)